MRASGTRERRKTNALVGRVEAKDGARLTRDGGMTGWRDELPTAPGSSSRHPVIPPSRVKRAPSFASTRPTKAFVFLLSLVPLALIAWKVYRDEYGEPIRDIEHETGEWALRFLAITLALTPLRRLFGWNVLAK